MADFSAPFNQLIQSNQAPPPNPLAMASQAVQLQAGMANAQRATTEADDAALANAQAHVGYILNGMAPVIAKGAAATANDMAQAGANIVAETKGRVSADEIAGFIRQAPTDGRGIAQYLQQHQLRLMNAMDQIRTLRGENADYDTGNGMKYGIRNSYTGQRTPQGGPNGFVPAATSPAQRIQPATVTDANGNTIQTTIGQRAAAAGMDPTSGVPFQNAITRRGGKFGTPMPSRSEGGAGDGQAAVGGIPGPAPSFGAGLEALNKDRLAASDAVAGLQPLLKALPLAQALGTTGSGPGTKALNDARTFLISQGIIKPDANVDIRNELDKYLNQAVAKSPLSGRSDMGTVVAQASSPNTTSQTNAATIGLIRNAIAQTRLGLAGPLAFSDNPSKYPAYKGGFIQGQDQRAYDLDLQPDGGRALVQKMAALPVGNAARTRFFESLKAAKLAGVGAGQ